PPALVRFRIPFTAGLRPSDGATFSLSPDGTTIGFCASRADEGPRIWVQTLDSFEPRPIPGSELTGDTGPLIWSPDGKTVVFQVGRKLRKSDLTGNVSQALCDTPDHVVGGSWSQDDVILFDSAFDFRDQAGSRRRRHTCFRNHGEREPSGTCPLRLTALYFHS